MVGEASPATHFAQVFHFALMASRSSFCGVIPRAAQYASISEMSWSMRGNIGCINPIPQGSFHSIPAKAARGIIPPMSDTTFKEALDYALDETKRSMRSVALASGVSYEQLKNLRQGKAQRTNVDDAVKVAHAFGVTLEQFLAGQLLPQASAIAVAGRVGGGAEVTLVDDHAKGDGLYHVACPAEIRDPRGIVAVEVLGDSMLPHYPSGSVLFYRRTVLGVTDDALNRVCVCEDEDGHAWVKVVRTGLAEGTFTLLSTNLDFEARHGVRLKWAARVLMGLSPDLVTRVA